MMMIMRVIIIMHCLVDHTYLIDDKAPALCVCEREREREYVCVCVCVCV